MPHIRIGRPHTWLSRQGLKSGLDNVLAHTRVGRVMPHCALEAPVHPWPHLIVMKILELFQKPGRPLILFLFGRSLLVKGSQISSC